MAKKTVPAYDPRAAWDIAFYLCKTGKKPFAPALDWLDSFPEAPRKRLLHLRVGRDRPVVKPVGLPPALKKFLGLS